MTPLALIQRFTDIIGLPRPSSAVGSSADDVRQIVELLNTEGRELSRRHDWQALTFEGSFTTVATESQGTLAAIIGATQQLRKIVNDTLWNRTTMQPVQGPLSKRTWQGYKTLSATGPWPMFRIRGNTLRMYPTPTTGHSVYFEYLSRCWCTDSGGVSYQTALGSDTDVLLLDDELMLAGLTWRWLQSKNLAYAEEFSMYEAAVADVIGADGMKPRLRMDGEGEGFRPGTLVPTGSWSL